MPNNLPLVSVLMTAFNRGKYIAEAIESVLQSTYTNFELIIVDDCSTDDTLEIANSFFVKDSRIKLYKNEKNLGQFANRNYAISLSTGEYIKFLDSDDKLFAHGLQTMVNSMIAFPDAGFGVPCIENNRIQLPYQLNPYDSVAKHYAGDNHLCYGPTGSIFKKNAIIQAGLFEDKYGILADTLLNIKTASLYPTVFFERDLFYWRRHNEQVTEEQNDNVRMIRERNDIVNASLAYAKLPLSENEKAIIKNNFIKINTRHFFNYVFKGQFKNALQVRKDTVLTLNKIFKAVFKTDTL